MIDRARHLVERLAFMGVTPADTGQVRTRKTTLTLASTIVTVLAVGWVVTYLALGLPESALIPFAYQVASVTILAVFARTKNYRFFRFSQLILMLLLPFLLQLSLGGYVASSAVSLWALFVALGALFFYSTRDAIPWFVAYIALTATAGLIEPVVSQHPAAIPVPIQTTFFVLNISGVALTAYLLLQYSVRARDAAPCELRATAAQCPAAPIAERLKRDAGRSRTATTTPRCCSPTSWTSPPVRGLRRPSAWWRCSTTSSPALTNWRTSTGWRRSRPSAMRTWWRRGCRSRGADHADAVAEMALEMHAGHPDFQVSPGAPLRLRIGISSGPVVAGVIGERSSSTTCGATR